MAKIISFAKYLYKGGNTGIYKRMFITVENSNMKDYYINNYS